MLLLFFYSSSIILFLNYSTARKKQCSLSLAACVTVASAHSLVKKQASWASSMLHSAWPRGRLSPYDTELLVVFKLSQK
jgi:hypothetical protein